MPSIRTLRTFLAVTRHGSLAAAARELGLTPAAVGLQVRRLEDDLERSLFDRSGRAVLLNPAGHALVGAVRELVARYDGLAGAAPAGPLTGTVVMGALVSALMGDFADALWTLKGRHPALDVRLYAGQSSEFARMVERGELDAAIVTQPPARLPASLSWTALYEEPMVMIVPRRPHFALPARAIDALREAPFIRFDRNLWTGQLVEQVLARCGAKVRDEMELNSVEAIIELVRQGFGVSIIPKLANLDWPRDRALVVRELPGVRIARRVGLLERRQHARQAFTGEIRRYFDERPARRRPTTRRTRGSARAAE